MNSILIYLELVLFFYAAFSATESFEGDACHNTNKNGDEVGTCAELKTCLWALSQIRQRFRIDHCGFEGSTPIVCCPLKEEYLDNMTSQQRSKASLQLHLQDVTP